MPRNSMGVLRNGKVPGGFGMHGNREDLTGLGADRLWMAVEWLRIALIWNGIASKRREPLWNGSETG